METEITEHSGGACEHLADVLYQHNGRRVNWAEGIYCGGFSAVERARIFLEKMGLLKHLNSQTFELLKTPINLVKKNDTNYVGEKTKKELKKWLKKSKTNKPSRMWKDV